MKPLILAIAALGLAGTIGTANAAQINDTFTLTIWNEQGCPGADCTNSSTDPREQALPTNPLAAGTPVYNAGTYTGPINFVDLNGSTTIAGFLATAGGTFNPSVTGLTQTISTAIFATTTLMDFTFTLPTGSSIAGATIMHDDGISIWDSTNTNEILSGASGPTVEVPTDVPTLTAGTYNLWYAEVNGLPADLVFNGTVMVPAPPIGQGLPAVIAVGGLLFGAWTWNRSKKRRLLGAATIAHAAA